MSEKHTREIWDTFYLIALQGFNYVAPLIVFPYLMVVLGAEKFGYIGFSLAIIQYLMLIVDFGFNLSATKRVALAKNDQEELNNIFSATLLAKLGLLLLSFVILLIFAFAIPRFSIYSSTMMIMFLMVIANTFSFVWLFQGLGKIRIISIINIISKLSILPLTFFLVKTKNDFLIAALIQSFVYILCTVITCSILFRNKYITNWFIPTYNSIITELKSSYPIFLSTAASSIYTSSYAVFLAFYSTPVEVGKYTAVEKIMRGFSYLILVPVIQSFYPKISSLSSEKRYEARKIIQKILIFVVVAMFFVFIIMFFLSPLLSSFLGKDYSGTLSIFRIMSVIPLFIGMGGVFGQLGILALGVEKDKKHFQRIYFIAGLMAFISIVILAPYLHAVGAAISLLLTELTVAIGMFWFSRRYIFQ
jgi:polysaccharide transporter, PST family